MAWKPSEIPDLTGRTFVITGANGGIGVKSASATGGWSPLGAPIAELSFAQLWGALGWTASARCRA